jgi:hypothetical protein
MAPEVLRNEPSDEKYVKKKIIEDGCTSYPF